jgi:precorrin-2 dehydrogenase/sirohydrochlorin ferrochelatase
MNVYPIHLLVEGLPVAVVGFHGEAAAKVRELAAAGAKVTWFAAGARAGDLSTVEIPTGVTLEGREPRVGELNGRRVVISTLTDALANRRLRAECQAVGALFNAVDQPAFCDFYAPAVVTRGPVTVAIGTGGASPSLARTLRTWLEDALPASLGGFAQLLAETRPALLAAHPNFADRARRTGRLTRAAFTHLRTASAPASDAELRAWIDTCLECKLDCAAQQQCCTERRIAHAPQSAPPA